MIRLLHLGGDVAALIGHVARLVPWVHLVIAGMLAAIAVMLDLPGDEDPLPRMVDSLRVAMIPLAVGLAFVLDDPVDRWLATPVPLAGRRWIRIASAGVATSLLWIGVLTVAEWDKGLPEGLPTGTLIGELIALTAITIAAAAWAVRRLDDGAGGIAAAPVALFISSVQLLLPPDWSLFAPYAHPPGPTKAASEGWAYWVVAHQRWAAITVFSIVLIAVASRDPGRRRIGHAIREPPASRPPQRSLGSKGDHDAHIHHH